jgi:hypothetical protein
MVDYATDILLQAANRLACPSMDGCKLLAAPLDHGYVSPCIAAGSSPHLGGL